MQPAPQIKGKVLCDLHSHPTNALTIDEMVDFIGSPGLIGLSARYTSTSILTYEIAHDKLNGIDGYREITPGKLSKFRDGYFARTQEVESGIHHIHAIGWDGDYIADNNNTIEVIKEIQDKNGIAILNHPYAIPWGPAFQIASGEDEQKVKSLLPHVNEVETHNAFNINYYVFYMRRANKLAEELIKPTEFKGVAASDCHDAIEQAKICGIYIDKNIINLQGMPGITKAIKHGNFEALKGPYISKWSFTKTMVFPRISQLFGFRDSL